MEKMTEKEEEQLRILSAKKKRIAREKEQFMRDVDEAKSEILAHWGITPADKDWKAAAELYGVSEGELYQHITSSQQVDYYKRTHKLTDEKGVEGEAPPSTCDVSSRGTGLLLGAEKPIEFF